MLLFLASLLAAAPLPAMPGPLMPREEKPSLTVTRTTRSALETKLDVGGLLGASWYVAPGRSQIEAAWLNAKGSLFGAAPLDGEALLLAAPVIGPWMVAHRDPQLDLGDRALLVTSGALQLLGLSVSAWRLANDEGGVAAESGPTLSLSPIAGGRLGLSVRLTGF